MHFNWCGTADRERGYGELLPRDPQMLRESHDVLAWWSARRLHRASRTFGWDTLKN